MSADRSAERSEARSEDRNAERSEARLEPRRVQHALVCMLFDPAYAAMVRGSAKLPELSVRERALLREVDPRALRSDPHRLARAVHALIDEYPVSAAVLGVAKVETFFASEAFRAGIRERKAMALTFGQWLGDRARGVGCLEHAMALLRRPLPAPKGELDCPPRFRGLLVPAGTLAFTSSVRARLGHDPVELLAQRREPWGERAPRKGTEPLLVERREDGSIDLGTASEPLVRLMRFAEGGRRRAEVEAEAIRRGAEPAEAGELIDELIADGLLCAPPTGSS
ncbi:hypothetical protein [Paraliomyxa miuraensis]|uniref:hypothetical protein n=1 Tax=Paraliomyxa miuraensis TaxID=376150 RepID=UPI00225862F6|nr:hypothetical protein [Paraliomyxa miuraensis]MCX4246591.1 hypothetical protein [Paraliomyxa miuraensis]